MKILLVLSATCLALSGCGNAHWHSINRSFSPTAGDSRLIDAKQRAIISIVNSEGTYRGTCAEPSPDALQATAAALGGSGSLTKEDITAAFNLAISGTESAASIGLRTQSIQLLRDAYYRICEGYLNGSLDAVSYDVLQRRFQNHMIALLAVEQLTGVVKAEQVALTSQSAADAGAQLGVLTAELRRQREELNDLNKRKQALEDTIAKLNTEIGNETDEDKKKKLDASLKDKESDQKTLETLIADQEKTVATLQSAVDEASRKTITAQSSTSATSFGGAGDAVRAQAMTGEVAKAVKEITMAAINQDYSGQVCTEALRVRGAKVAKSNEGPELTAKVPESGDIFRKFCDDLLVQIVDSRKDLTDAVIQIGRYKAETCRNLVRLAAELVAKLKQDSTVAEAGVVLAAFGSIQEGCGSSGSELSFPDPVIKHAPPDQNATLQLF